MHHTWHDHENNYDADILQPISTMRRCLLVTDEYIRNRISYKTLQSCKIKIVINLEAKHLSGITLNWLTFNYMAGRDGCHIFCL